MALSARELVLVLRVQSAGAGDLRRLRTELAGLQRGASFERVGRSIRSAGTAMQFLGAAGVVGMGLAAKEAADFQHQTMLVATQTGRTANDIVRNQKIIGTTIQNQMRSFPASADDMSKALYDIYSSLDVSLGGGAKLLRIFNREAVAGATDLGTVTSAGITVMNDFGGGAKEMTTRANEMFSAVRFGRTTFDELSQSMNTLVPAFKQGHQSFETMISAMAFMTRRMPNTSMAATALSRSIDILSRAKFVEGLKKAGVQITDARGNLLRFDIVIQRILKRFPQLTQGNISNFLKDMSGTEGTVQARRALTFLFHDFAQYRQMIHQVEGDHVEFNRSFETMSKTATVQWGVLVNKIHVGVMRIGAEALPVFTRWAGKIETAINALDSLSGAIGVNIVKWASIGAIVTLLAGTFFQLTGFAIEGIAIFVSLTASMVGWTTSMVAATFAAEELAAAEVALGSDGTAIIAAMGAQDAAAAATATGGFAVLTTAVIAAGAALVGFEIYLSSTAPPGPMGQIQTRLHAFTEAMKNVKTTADLMQHSTQSMAMLRQAKNFATGDVHKYRTELSKAAKGTDAYKTASQQLSGALRAQHQATQMLDDAQKRQITSMNKLRNQLHPALADLRVAQANLGILRNQAAAPTGGIQSGSQSAASILANKRLGAAQRLTSDAMDKGAPGLIAAINAYNTAVKNGLNTNTQAAKSTLQQIVALQAQYEGLGTNATRALQNMSSMMGRVLTTSEQQFIGTLGPAGLKIAAIFGQITHKLPSRATIGTILNEFGRLSPIAAEIAAQTGKIPTVKSLKILDNIKSSAIPDVLAFIRRTNKIPTEKQLKIIVKHDNALNAAQDQLSHLQDMRVHIPKVRAGLDSSQLDRDIQRAQHKVDALTKKKNKSTIFLQTHPNNVNQYGVNIGNQVSAGIVAGAGHFSSALGAQINAQVSAAVHMVRVTWQIGSPSKLVAKLVGEPLMDGILLGVDHKKKDVRDALKSAMSDAVSNLMSWFNDRRGMLSEQVGELFSSDALQTTRDFGGKFTFKALQTDLNSRYHAMVRFQQSVNKLRRRGVSQQLAEQLRALGPSHQAEVTALLSATPAQLKSYNRTFVAQQAAITRMTKSQESAQIKAWESQGKNIALGFIRGMDQYAPQMTFVFRRIFANLYRETQRVHRSHSPSRLYMQEGMNVAKGYLIGLDRGLAGGNPRLPGVQYNGGRLSHAGGRPVIYQDNTKYEIHTMEEKASLSATLRRYDARRRHKPLRMQH